MNISKFSNTAFWISVILFLICFFVVLCPISVFSQTEQDRETSPLHVTSDRAVAQRDTSMVEFIGNVKATYQDTVLLADSVKVFFNETDDKRDETPQSNVKKVVATGNVRGTAGNRKAFADKAVYTAEDDVLVLTGTAPRLVTGSSFVTGKKITWFRLQDKVIAESDGTNRVEALFNPEDDFSEKE